MNIPVLRVKNDLRLGESYNIFIISDLHIGARDFNEKAFHKSMSRVYDKCNEIIILGDIFDAIFTKDKRYTPIAIDSKLSVMDDQLNGAIDMAYRILEPYAGKIRLITKGNHEMSITKYSSIDILKLLVGQLNDRLGTDIRVGGYGGYIQYGFAPVKGRVCYYNMLYEHGHGGASTVTKGMIDINRKKVDYSFDGFFFGHKHSKISDIDTQILLSNTGKVMNTTRISAQVGTFKNMIFNSLDVGWEDTKGFSPSANGGVMLTLEMMTEGKDYYIGQEITL